MVFEISVLSSSAKEASGSAFLLFLFPLVVFQFYAVISVMDRGCPHGTRLCSRREKPLINTLDWLLNNTTSRRIIN